MSAFGRGIARAVRGSLGRFLAIVGIVALGCGFFAGLQMSGPDMRTAADAYYDGTALWDLRVVSTQGLGEKDLARLAATDGVSAVAGVTSVDAMASIGDEQVAVRVTSLPEAYLEGGEPTLDRLVLRDGRWPRAAGECVVSADNPALAGRVGQQIQVTREAGDGGLLAVQSFTVVGTVSSSAYPYTVSFGTTTLGSGSIDQYLYVPSDAFAEDAPLTEAHLAVEGAAAEKSGSPAYERVVGEVSARLEGAADELARARLADVRAEAQDEVDAARADLEEERAAAEEELASARAELDDAAEQIEAGEAELASGQTALDAARSELEAKRSEAASELTAARDALDASAAELDARTAELDAAATDAEAARAAVETGVPALLASLAEQGIQATDLDGTIAAIDAALTQVTDEAGRQALLAAREQAAQLASARDAVAAYDAGRAQLEDAAAQLDAARTELTERQAAADAQIRAAEDEIASRAAQFASARAKLAAARADYEEGLAAWDASRADAGARLAEAEAKIDDAQAEVDALEPGELYVLDRTQNEGTATFQADSERMDTIATVFPVMFFLVAALVALTTMARMVEDERSLIGLYKALGYGTARIAGKYLAYAGIAAGVGAALGIMVLTQVLPLVIMAAYGIIYAVPQLPLPLPADPSVALLSAGLGVGVTLLATLAAVVSALRSTPAALMQPRAPKAGRRIPLERVSPLWHRLSFLRKVTARNLFRYKKRLLMTIAGISGCTALLLVGFGLHDAIWDIIDNQFGQIVHYDTTITLADDAGEQGADDAAALLASQGTAEELARVHQENLQARSSAAEGAVAVRAIVAEDATAFERAVTLRDRVTHEPITLAPGAVLLGEKTASKLGVRAGDTVALVGQDSAGNAVGEGVELRVAGVTRTTWATSPTWGAPRGTSFPREA